MLRLHANKQIIETDQTQLQVTILRHILALQVEEVDALTDPCPLPSTLKKRGLNERERLLYAPMADVGGLLYDKDAVYIDIPDWKVSSFCLKFLVSRTLYVEDLGPQLRSLPVCVHISAHADRGK